jgi:hypothetical protein
MSQAAFSPNRWTALCVALAVAGCSARPQGEQLTTHAVSGVVLAKDGKPVAGGAIQFHGVDDPNLASIGEISSEGKFTLRTNLADGTKVEGAVAGNYRVTVFPPADAPQTAAVHSPQATYRVEPRDNQLTIQLDQ